MNSDDDVVIVFAKDKLWSSTAFSPVFDEWQSLRHNVQEYVKVACWITLVCLACCMESILHFNFSEMLLTSHSKRLVLVLCPTSYQEHFRASVILSNSLQLCCPRRVKSFDVLASVHFGIHGCGGTLKMCWCEQPWWHEGCVESHPAQQCWLWFQPLLRYNILYCEWKNQVK